jgi:hypothetical protein
MERFLGARAGLDGVGEYRQPVVGGDVEAVEVQAEFAGWSRLGSSSQRNRRDDGVETLTS